MRERDTKPSRHHNEGDEGFVQGQVQSARWSRKICHASFPP
jgi:hypothetical protein